MKTVKEMCYQVKVQSHQENFRLDQFLGQINLFKNRSQALKNIKREKILLKQKPLKASYRLKAGDILKIYISESSKEIASYNFPVEIVYEDEDVLVINKEAGLVVHPAPGHESDTLVNVLFHRKKLSSGSDPFRPGVVHRLDKDTSGLLVLAKNDFSEENLVQQFKDRSVKRVYWGLCLKLPEKEEGRIESYFSRHIKDRKKFQSLASFQKGAKKGITNYKILKKLKKGVWMEYVLETGRTHQIRLHSADLKAPLLGDKVYGDVKMKFIKDEKWRAFCKSLNRVALHAQSLEFIHPRTKKKLQFKTTWPEDLKKLLKALNS